MTINTRSPGRTTAAIFLLAGAATPVAAEPFSAVFELRSINGANGFVIHGTMPGDWIGSAVSNAGDVNGDGHDDLIIGAAELPHNGELAGGGVVVFGGPGVGADGAIDISALDGSDGFRFFGVAAQDFCGYSVAAAGDINGDGFDDLLIGAPNADTGVVLNTGMAYIVFGSTQIGADGLVDLSTLDGSDGFRCIGNHSYAYGANSVAGAGDVNGDGFDDLLIAAHFASPAGISAPSAGRTTVLFGSSGIGFGGTVHVYSVNGYSGFACNGIDAYDNSGSSVASAGDVNGDGLSDYLIGARKADPNGSASGETYLVFGTDSIVATAAIDLDDLNGANGFVCKGIAANHNSGRSVDTAGDINGDGYADIIIGAAGANPNGPESGESYVIFGGPNAGATGAIELATLDGANGFACRGIDPDDSSGFSVAAAGDINHDGFGDLLIGAWEADPGGKINSGETYIVFGSQSIGAGGALELSSLNGANGFVCIGEDELDRSGRSVSSAGDINGDGIDDLIILAHGARPFEDSIGGACYVVFGRCARPADLNSDGLTDTADLGILIAGFGSTEPAADINGDGIVDTADLGILIADFGSTCP